MRYLLLSSFIFLIMGCSSVYKNLRPATGNLRDIDKFKPNLTRALYKAEVDVTGHHLSGLLLIKTLPDSSVRLIFSSEVGLKFFDFEFKPSGDFKVYYIFKQMDKKPVIKTLKKDFELVMMTKHNADKTYFEKSDTTVHYVFKHKNDYYRYVTNINGSQLLYMERASAREPVVDAMMKNYVNGVPDTIGITHKNFSFTIGLKRVER